MYTLIILYEASWDYGKAVKGMGLQPFWETI